MTTTRIPAINALELGTTRLVLTAAAKTTAKRRTGRHQLQTHHGCLKLLLWLSILVLVPSLATARKAGLRNSRLSQVAVSSPTFPLSGKMRTKAKGHNAVAELGYQDRTTRRMDEISLAEDVLFGDDSIITLFGKGKSKRTPEPTPMPTLAPTKKPTPAPSSSPTDVPTKPPTPGPTPTPTLSAQPSAEPTEEPSALPTGEPTAHSTTVPSTSPSAQPSSTPSTAPSSMPSVAPSAPPTTSSQPSISPTKLPSVSPSEVPSAMPTVSMAPTFKTFDETEITTFNADGGEETVLRNACSNEDMLEDERGNTRTETLNYQYNVNLASFSDREAAVAAVESKIFKAMSFHFLTCNFMENDDGQTFHVVAITAGLEDLISNEDLCMVDDGNDDTQCYVVKGSTNVDLFYPPSRRRRASSSSEVLTEVGRFLIDLLDGDTLLDTEVGILGTAFEGFTDLATDDTDKTGNDGLRAGGAAAGAQSGDVVSRDRPAPILGGLAVGVAGLCFIIVSVFVIKRNRRHDEDGREYAEHLDDFSTGSNLKEGFEKSDLNATLPSMDDDGPPISRIPQIIIGEDEVETGGCESSICSSYVVDEDSMEDPELYGHHQCASATCAVCRSHEVQPIFSRVAPTRDLRATARDLAPARYRSSDSISNASDQSSDTVNL